MSGTIRERHSPAWIPAAGAAGVDVELEVETIVRQVALAEWSPCDPCGRLAILSALGGFASLFLWHAQLCEAHDVGAFLVLAGSGYLLSRRTCLPVPDDMVGPAVIGRINRSPRLPGAFKRKCTATFYQGILTHERLADLAREYGQPAPRGERSPPR